MELHGRRNISPLSAKTTTRPQLPTRRDVVFLEWKRISGLLRISEKGTRSRASLSYLMKSVLLTAVMKGRDCGSGQKRRNGECGRRGQRGNTTTELEF